MMNCGHRASGCDRGLERLNQKRRGPVSWGVDLLWWPTGCAPWPTDAETLSNDYRNNLYRMT